MEHTPLHLRHNYSGMHKPHTHQITTPLSTFVGPDLHEITLEAVKYSTRSEPTHALSFLSCATISSGGTMLAAHLHTDLPSSLITHAGESVGSL